MAAKGDGTTLWVHFFQLLACSDCINVSAIALSSFHGTCTGWAKKTGPILRVYNITKVGVRNACYRWLSLSDNHTQTEHCKLSKSKHLST